MPRDCAAADADDQDHETCRAKDFARMAQLVTTYADFPLGGTDANVIALAERIGAEIVVTLDRRHFAAVKPNDRDAFQLLP
jgi:predicted nucleic acid-binding protein